MSYAGAVRRLIELVSTAVLCLGYCSGCAPSVSQVPLSSEAVAGGYYYGVPERGGKQLDDQPSSASSRRSLPSAKPKPAPAQAKQDTKPEPDADDEDVEAASKAEGQVAPVISPEDYAASFGGEFQGKDVVSIRFDGFPEQVQEDENAKMRVTVNGLEVSVTVVDSNSGGDLCTVKGQPEKKQTKQPKVVFPAGQQCFANMLGGPMAAELTGGWARVQDDTLRVEFDVKLEVSGADDTLNGSLGYVFEGQRQ